MGWCRIDIAFIFYLKECYMNDLNRIWRMAFLLAGVVWMMGCAVSLDSGGGGAGNCVTGNREPNNCGKDGTANKCKTVVIGNYTWMTENINRKIGNSWCYDDNESNCDRFGRLYDWNTALEVCPEGFHLSSSSEWNDLTNAMGGSSVSAKKLKSNAANGTNNYGFSAELGGGWSSTDKKFVVGGANGYWWTSTESSDSEVVWRYVAHGIAAVGSKGDGDKGDGLSVRCVQGIAISETEKVLLDSGMIVLDAVYFETGSANIHRNSKPYLKTLAKMLVKYPKLKLEVGGHTDNTGGLQVNMTLSQKRADAVAGFMREQEPALSGMLSSKGYGPTEPAADNDTDEGRETNRRVELKVLNPEVLSEYK
jgi:uncharacterized protein (TIGR02145 family)